MKKIFMYMIMCFIVFIVIFPIVWTLLGSFKELRDLVTPVPKIVFKPTLSNYKAIFVREDIRNGLINSVIISVSALILGILFGVPAAYAIAKNTQKLKPHLQFFALSLRFLPPVAIAIPFITLWLELGLYDTHIALIITYLIISISTIMWLSVPPFENIPIECEEAAKLEGCSYIQVFLKISLPLALPNLMGG
ncbi:carbohydrate ABC transporter permease, partial [Candidatus Aerophobetes bacterium]|nr:carbohydrate ABC transporter permease [Candidatus Aerophobetes bacterium]